MIAPIYEKKTVPAHIYDKMLRDAKAAVERLRGRAVDTLNPGDLYDICFAAKVPVKEVMRLDRRGNLSIMLIPASVEAGENRTFVVRWQEGEQAREVVL